MNIEFADQHRSEQTLDQQVDQLLKTLTLEEKVWLMHGEPSFQEGLEGFIKEDSYHTRPCRSGSLPQHDIDGIRFIDGPRGVVLFGGATSFPVPMARGASFDTELERRIGQAIGREHRTLGGNLFGGVCINLLRHPGWGRAQETYGEDPLVLGEMGAALTLGVQENVMACVKHFAVNSIENARFQVDVRASKRALHEVYLPHFKRVVDAGVACVMSAYNSLNGEWCGQNRWLLRDTLKQRWGFKGFVITDFLFGMRDAKLAALAGQDIEMPFKMHYARFLPDLVKSGDVPERLIDDAVGRILRTQFQYQHKPVPDKAVLGCDAHKALAREAAQKSLVLLKNDMVGGVALLPLDKHKSVAVIGKLAQQANLGDRGSSDGRPDYVVTPLEGIQRAVGNSSQVLVDDGIDLDSAAAAASKVDTAVVVVGYTHEDEGEYISPISMEPFADGIQPPGVLDAIFKTRWLAPIWRKIVAYGSRKRMEAVEQSDEERHFGTGGDRRSLRLSAAQVALIKRVCEANSNTVVLVMSGSAVMMNEWHDQASAIMMVWYPGMEGGNAIADVLFGDVAPSGRLPFSVPVDEAHLPHFDPDATEIEYELWHGYRKLAIDGNSAAYAHGFGLSYGKFELGRLVCDSKEIPAARFAEASLAVRFEVSNVGEISADHVWQLYASRPGSPVPRAPRQLAAFGRVSLAAGETKLVDARLRVADLAYFNEQKNEFELEPGTLRLVLSDDAEAPEISSVMINIVAE